MFDLLLPPWSIGLVSYNSVNSGCQFKSKSVFCHVSFLLFYLQIQFQDTGKSFHFSNNHMAQWNLFDIVNSVILKFPANNYYLLIINYYYNNNYNKSQSLL